MLLLKRAGMIPPIPPIELRRSVGIEDTALFDNPTGNLTFGTTIPGELYRRVLDFGCGCGRVARQMLLQSAHVPERYQGLDLYRPSILWCQQNLARPGWEFRHVDVFNVGFNPRGREQESLNLKGETFSLVNAHSVFTHIIERNLEFYFSQAAAAVAADGVMRVTWFLFDKINFPMMQTFQNCLYINADDASNACVYDVEFVRDLYSRHGLTITVANAPGIRGHQWELLARRGQGAHVAFAADTAPTGLARPPVRVT